MLDDATPMGASRYEARQHLDEHLFRPLGEEEAEAYDRELWAEKNVAAASAQGMGEEDDPFLAQPVNR
jgi:hypothetical protein